MLSSYLPSAAQGCTHPAINVFIIIQLFNVFLIPPPLQLKGVHIQLSSAHKQLQGSHAALQEERVGPLEQLKHYCCPSLGAATAFFA